MTFGIIDKVVYSLGDGRRMRRKGGRKGGRKGSLKIGNWY